MELTDREIEAIKRLSKEIDFGKITINLTGTPHEVVDIVAEKVQRFHRQRNGVTVGEPVDRRRSGRY
jgi:hypothetical protein